LILLNWREKVYFETPETFWISIIADNVLRVALHLVGSGPDDAGCRLGDQTVCSAQIYDDVCRGLPHFLGAVEQRLDCDFGVGDDDGLWCDRSRSTPYSDGHGDGGVGDLDFQLYSCW